jgi:hypothetical protein
MSHIVSLLHLGLVRQSPNHLPSSPPSVKYITDLTVTDSLKGFGKGLGSGSPEGGYACHAGI